MEGEFLGQLIKTMGELFLAYTVLKVHHGVMNERKIDSRVLREMKKEQLIGIVGVTLIVVGFVITWWV